MTPSINMHLAAEEAANASREHEAAVRVRPIVCQWFLLCTNDATTRIKHPVLGDVPACERCAKLYHSHGSA